MKLIFAALLCSLSWTASAQAEVVLPRLSPLAVVDAEGLPTGETVVVAFGQPLRVMDRAGTMSADVVTVQDAAGARFAVSSTDLIAPAAGQAGLVAMPEPGRDSGDRPDLPLWDSAARARLYLQGGGADSLRPALTEQPGGVFPISGLPVFAVETAPTTIGHPVLMAGALVPVMPEALDPSGTAAPSRVVLHVLVDGSDYAREFTLETLQGLSRAVADAGPIADFSRHVIYDNGASRDEGQVSAAGLRAEWPEADAAEGAGGGATLTDALADAMMAMADAITPGDGAAHVVLVLVGPGLVADADALARVAAAGQRLSDLRAGGVDLRGVVLAQGTPEPNPANDVLLGQMAGGATTRFADFGGDVLGNVTAALTAAPEGDATALATRRAALCALASERALPCVIAANGVLPPVAAAADWVALPLWFVLDGAAMTLVPAGMASDDARAAQDDIRACHAAGLIWSPDTAECAAMAASMAGALPADADADSDALRADLVAVQRELSLRSQERDAAVDDLYRQTADWDDQRSALRAETDAALADLAAAQQDLDSRAETIAALEAAVADQSSVVDELTDRADALVAAVSDLQAELDAATRDASGLRDELDARDAALLAASEQVADLTVARDAALNDLSLVQEERATLEADRDRVAAELATRQAEQAAADVALAQERATAQEQAAAAAQALADMTAQMTAAQDETAAQVAALTAEQAALLAQRDDLTAQLAEAAAARTTAESALADTQAQARKAAEVAETDAKKTTAQLLAAQADYVALVAERDDLAARLSEQTARADDLATIKADLSLAEGDIRAEHASVTRQLTDAQARLAELATARETAMTEAVTAQTALADVTDRLAGLQAERDALAAQMAEMQGAAASSVQDMTSRLTRAEAEVARLTAELATARTAAPIAEDMTAPDDTLTAGTEPGLRPKARPAVGVAVAVAEPARKAAPAQTVAPKVAQPVAPARTVKAAAKAAPAPVPSRRVAPATAAPQLKGCQFQWVGKEGRLVCP